MKTELTEAAEKVQFGEATPAKAAEDFYAAAKTAIGKSPNSTPLGKRSRTWH